MLEETQNKYVGERRGSLKKTCYMIWKKIGQNESRTFFKGVHKFNVEFHP
jgi:glucose-6-phosphate isomerase